MFSQTDSPPRLRGITWSTVRLVLAGAAVLAGPAVARQHRLAGDPAAVDVARDAHEADQPDHLGPVEAHRLGAQDVVAALEHLGLLLQDQHQGAADGADVERLVARVEDQHPPPGQAAGGGYRYLAVSLRSGAGSLPFRWAGSWPFSDARPFAGTVTACTVAPLPISRAIVDGGPTRPRRLRSCAATPRDPGRRDRPAAEHPDRFGLGAQLLDRARRAAHRPRPPRCRGRTCSGRGRGAAGATRSGSG